MRDRKLQVHHLVARGLTNSEVGKVCGIAEKTVKAHITALHRQYGVRNRVELALKYHGIPFREVQAEPSQGNPPVELITTSVV